MYKRQVVEKALEEAKQKTAELGTLASRLKIEYEQAEKLQENNNTLTAQIEAEQLALPGYEKLEFILNETGQKKQQLEKEEHLLEKSRQEQTEFIAAASHELRSPLAVILSGISAMKKADSKEQGHFLSVIEKEGTRMSLLINDMLSLSNADNHSWKMHPVFCELDTLLLDTYEKYEPLMQDHHMKFFIELPEEEIPPCPCDPERISQVLGILLDNAISYVPENGKIILSLSQTETHFLIRVKDNGPGIPDSAKTSVFRRFYRADSARNNRQHFGLGLCIAYEIISLHKGTISVLDTPGGGSTFQISLPLA